MKSAKLELKKKSIIEICRNSYHRQITSEARQEALRAVLEKIERELRTMEDVPLYLEHYKFPEIIREIRKKLKQEIERMLK